jgi:hypothetical protein
VIFPLDGGVYLYIVKRQKTCPFAMDGFFVIGEGKGCLFGNRIYINASFASLELNYIIIIII